MTKQEFQERVGYAVSDADFDKINQMYLESGQNMDKDAFCEDYKKHSDSVLLAIFFNRVDRLEDKLDVKREELGVLLNCLLKKAAEYNDDEMLNKAIQVVGEAAVIKRKAHLGLPFTDAEREYIIENLK